MVRQGAPGLPLSLLRAPILEGRGRRGGGYRQTRLCRSQGLHHIREEEALEGGEVYLALIGRPGGALLHEVVAHHSPLKQQVQAHIEYHFVEFLEG